ADFELKGVEIDGTRVGRGNGSGVVLNGVSNAVVEGNLFVDVGTAVDVRVGAGLTVPASGNRIVRNGIERAGLGVTVCGFGASGNLVADNAFEEVQVGVSVEEDAEGNVLANNDVAEAAVAGFQVLGASRNVLFGGTVFDSSRGVVVDGLRSTFRSCRSNPAGTVTERNAVFGLTASRNLVGVEVGSASVTDPVARTTVVASDLRDNEIGASLGANSTRSRVLFNDLRGNAAPVQDAGTGNRVFANRL
ncbi:MAG TPA: right-handed parallel beta-helix repeat-containing protein, partial [Polyangiaceae bacterium LLY-WYZ-14_1]|nr:right-handed parallel beta-helix repeat-containing protein [Polyangiaceae bacterium LLY-WYZ-14_1]